METFCRRNGKVVKFTSSSHMIGYVMLGNLLTEYIFDFSTIRFSCTRILASKGTPNFCENISHWRSCRIHLLMRDADKSCTFTYRIDHGVSFMYFFLGWKTFDCVQQSRISVEKMRKWCVQRSSCNKNGVSIRFSIRILTLCVEGVGLLYRLSI